MSAKTLSFDTSMKIGNSIVEKNFGRGWPIIHYTNGGIFISCMQDGKMMAAYWHPTKKHSATCVHFWSTIAKKDEADPGYWAVTVTNTPFMGGQTKFDVW